MAAYPYMAITDGTTTITFLDGVSATPGDYAIEREGWAPAVASRRLDELNATSEWAEVVEQIPINITGSTVAAFYANAAALKALLDKADQYWMGLSQTPVLFRWIPQGSSRAVASPYEAMILGRAAGDQLAQALNLGPRWLEGGYTRYGLGLTMAFWRRGLWLNETDTATSGAASAGTIWSATLSPTWATPSPIDVRWQIPTLSATRGYLMGTQLLALVANASDITVIEAESASIYGPNVATSVIANARGGNVARYSPGATQSDMTYSSLAAPTAAGLYAIYASVSTASAVAGQFSIRASVGIYGTSGVQLPMVAVPVIHSAGQTSDAIFLGMFSLPLASSLKFLFVEVNSSLASSTLDIDYFVIIKLTTTTSIITIDSSDARGPLFGFGDFGASSTQRQNIQHALTSQLYPLPIIENTAGSVQGSLQGVNGPMVFPAIGTNVSGIWMGANHANGSTAEFNGGYRAADSANAVYSPTFTVTRRRGYLIPE